MRTDIPPEPKVGPSGHAGGSDVVAARADEQYDAGYGAGYKAGYDYAKAGAKADEKAAYTKGYDAAREDQAEVERELEQQKQRVFGGGYVKIEPVVTRVTPAEAIEIRDALEDAIIGWDRDEDSAPSGLPRAIALADALIRNGWVTAAPEAKVTL